MKGFYEITQQLKDSLIAEPFVNTVTFGNIDDIDLDKQNIFPLSHIIINNCSVGTSTLTFNISILFMGIVDISNSETTDKFRGNDDEQDVLNTQLATAVRIINKLQRGDLFSSLYQVIDDVACEPFMDRFENKLAGWTATFDVEMQNEMTICD
tara:strand:+ start:1068 stop:1526 length:459 start_codon:yes stop_codon:yes gene_type:complete